MQPSYIQLHKCGSLEKTSVLLNERISACDLCPRRCRADRVHGKIGMCRTGALARVFSCNAHFGEEACLVGTGGSGTIFFSNCNLSCIFCQNYDISQIGMGREVPPEELAEMMLLLQKKGCHNINFVSPTHVIAQIISALVIAVSRGLEVPLVYNSGGYDSVETLKLIEGVFDIYMPDLKYMDPDISEKLSGAGDYPTIAVAAIREMHRQTGDLVIGKNGLASRGLLVRHLVLPNNLAATERVIAFIAELSKNTYINIMDQYRPEFRARECFDLRRRITLEEYDRVVDLAVKSGLLRLDSRMKFRS